MSVTVRQLAEWVRGEVLGDADLPISNARTLTDAQPGDITFVEDERHLGAWHASRASAAVVPATVPVNGRPLIRVADPLMAFAHIVQHLRGRPAAEPAGIDPTAHVHPSARLGPGVSVGPFAVVGEQTQIGPNTTLHAGATVGRFCTLGADVTIHPRVVLYDECKVGNRVVIHANAVIGADGFGYRLHNGQHVKVPQLGWVEIEDDVEVGACATIDRGTFGPTLVGAGTKIDNLVMVGHNCRIGRHNILAGQVGIAGSCTTGDYVVMAGQVGVADHLNIGERAVLAAQSGITKDVPAGATVFGTPAAASQDTKRRLVALSKLPGLFHDIQRIKQHLGLKDG
ncbi:MAG TPA: UDP-3-O-(3-hydroxymyristoyl)glucosamine N-acyltransferase [Gemmataceae bacterium]|nr:UDP-3-O-(3-hydroxymyristoyl)glucosamine N-acyltransferase [Gemmataceae bacterium]